jgi:tetratricopeptide (TPR) repeat protein
VTVHFRHPRCDMRASPPARTSTVRAGHNVNTAVTRVWGRYQLRLAVGRAALGRPLDALKWARRAVNSLQRIDINDKQLAAAFGTLATCYRSLGDLDHAEVARRRQIGVLDAVAPGGVEWVNAMIELGDLCRFRGHHDDAEALLVRVLDVVTQPNLAADPMLKARTLTVLGIEYKDTGRYDEAARTYGEALELVTVAEGSDHLSAASLWHNLAGLALARGNPGQAVPAAARAVRIRERELGPDHHLVAEDLAVLGSALSDQSRIDQAELAFQRALRIFEASRPVDHYEVAVNLSNLGICQLRRGDSASAEALLRRGLDIKKTVFGNYHPEIARQLNNLAVAVGHQQRSDEADELHREALTIARHTLGADHPLTRTCRKNTVPPLPRRGGR